MHDTYDIIQPALRTVSGLRGEEALDRCKV